MSDWQPIKTAPHDQVIDLLAYYPKTGRYRRFMDCEYYENSLIWGDYDGDPIEWGPDEYGQSCVVTHWQPLPEPPKGEHDGE